MFTDERPIFRTRWISDHQNDQKNDQFKDQYKTCKVLQYLATIKFG